MTKSGSSPKPTVRRNTRWWTYAAGLVCLALTWPLYQYNVSHWRRQSVLSALEEGDNATAISQLEVEQKAAPQSSEIAYWLAVAHRRAGFLSLFQDHLQRAKELGHPEEELQTQFLLMRIQSGGVGPQIEQRAEELVQRAEQYSGRRFNLYIDEFYEAQARGCLANYQLFDAEVALDHWVQARPNSALPRLMRANIRKRESNYQVAEREYREALALSPGNVEARLDLAHLLLINLNVAEAAEEYRYVIKVAPDENVAQIGLAECEYRSGEGIEAARERLLNVLEKKLTIQERANALAMLGEIFRTKKQNELAAKYLRESVELFDTPHSGPYRTLASAYASLGKLEEAKKYMKISQEKVNHTIRLKELTDKIIDSPNDAGLRFEQGNIFVKLGQKDEAAGWWNMAVRLDPQFQPAHEALAGYYESTGDRERMEHHRRLAEKSSETTFNALWLDLLDSNVKSVREGLPKLAGNPSLSEPVELLTLGLNVVERKDMERSAQGLGRLTENPRLRMRALTMLAEALYHMGHYNASERAYQEVLVASPRNVVAHRGLQFIYFDLGAYDQMEFHALEVAKIDRTDYRPHRHLGFLRREAETWEAAIRDYQESLRRSPHQPTREEVLLEMADCYVHLLKYQEALDTLIEARPSAQKSFLEAQCLFATKRVTEARKLLDESLKTAPDHAPSLLLRSDIALTLDDVQEARGLLERAVEAAPFDNNAHQKLATVLLRLDENDEARKAAGRAKELLDLHLRASELHNVASQRPKDIAVRKELAALARQLGREEEAQRWERVVEGMTEEPVLARQNSTVPMKAPVTNKLNLAPELQGKLPKAGPPPIPAVKPQAETAIFPKVCGDEPAAEARDKKSAERKEETKEEKKDEVFSGPQKGEELPGFTLKISGEEEKELDIVKDAAGKPALIIFVHAVTRPSVGMARVLGDYAATRKKDGLHAGVVFLTADATDTKAWIKRASGALPKDVPLGIAEGGQEGPGAYGLNRNVTMTILVAKEGKVTANFALVQPSLQADGPKILKEIVDVLGGGKVPSIEELSKPPQRKEGEKSRS